MRGVLLLGLAAVLAALLMAYGKTVLSHEAMRVNASLAGDIFTIPLAAAIKL